MKVEFVKLNSANVTADNSSDATKVYEITANVSISENKVNRIDGGRVIKDGIEVASFSKWGENSSNKQFNGVSADEELHILQEINKFCSNVIEKLENEPINI